jgi:sulfonate transport system substrate-binding protein
MKTRRLIAALALALTAVAGAACSSNSGSSAVRSDGSVDLTKVTLRVGDQKGTAVQALLQAAGELNSVPYHISWSQYTSGPPILEAINAGAVDVGAVGNAPPVFAAAADSRIKIVGSYDNGLAGQAIVVPQNSPITSPDQLRGKKIAVAKGSSAHYELLAVLKNAGLGFSDIQPQYLQPPDALAALSTGRVDAWAIWDPYTAQAQQQTGARILVDGANFGRDVADSFVIAGDDALGDKARTAALRDFLARFARAHSWANSHPQQWSQIFAQLTHLPPSVALQAAERDHFTNHLLDPEVIGGEQKVADAFYGAHLIPAAVTISDFIDECFNS